MVTVRRYNKQNYLFSCLTVEKPLRDEFRYVPATHLFQKCRRKPLGGGYIFAERCFHVCNAERVYKNTAQWTHYSSCATAGNTVRVSVATWVACNALIFFFALRPTTKNTSFLYTAKNNLKYVDHVITRQSCTLCYVVVIVSLPLFFSEFSYPRLSYQRGQPSFSRCLAYLPPLLSRVHWRICKTLNRVTRYDVLLFLSTD